jgi:phosphoribosylanthranilate isomerase
LGAKSPFILKICGLSGIAPIRWAEACGATHIGLVVEAPRSPRSVTRSQARMLARATRATAVMVTTAEEAGDVIALARTVQPAVVQLHGAPPSVVGALRDALPGVGVWLAVAVEAGAAPNLEAATARIEAAEAAGADAIVLDSARGGQAGGTGVAMDWEAAAQLVERAGQAPVILAGGLDPANVAEAIRRARPAGVDVSSGVELTPNTKSPASIRAFCAAVRQVTGDPIPAK